MWLCDLGSGQQVHPGDNLTDFRGERWKFLYITRAPNGPSTGRVFVEDKYGERREYYPSVFDTEIVLSTLPASFDDEVYDRELLGLMDDDERVKDCFI